MFLRSDAICIEHFARRKRRDMLDKSALVLLLGRKIESKASLGSLKTTVNVAMTYRFVPPLVGVYVGFLKQRIDCRRCLCMWDRSPLLSVGWAAIDIRESSYANNQ